ncbi:hypothetical protein NIES23_40720 [Trichormus variabilis NIES-23]|uniref:Uncharacterized protein n=1 Tax=Trichormus variabilis NIES-23 TaxID=1973479 RepID=A0A1Z4KQG0_ANAVA|nr:hypothetical protein NIES23_40720 [Trichormus variabilis NIES-23]
MYEVFLLHCVCQLSKVSVGWALPTISGFWCAMPNATCFKPGNPSNAVASLHMIHKSNSNPIVQLPITYYFPEFIPTTPTIIKVIEINLTIVMDSRNQIRPTPAIKAVPKPAQTE